MALKSQLMQEHVSENHPNARLISYDSPESDLTFYDDQTLKDADAGWFPLSCHKDERSGKLIVGGGDGIYHTYIEGETGVGKTTRFCMQSIRALSMTKHKPSFILTDMHGEIIENLYLHLVKNGYTIKIINCDEPDRSDTYNPLACIAEEVQTAGYITHDAVQNVRHISEIMQPVEAKTDPIWEQGARAYTMGSIFDKVEDILAGELAPEYLTLYNLIQSHYWLRRQIEEKYNANIFDIPHYKNKERDALSVQKMISVTNNAEKTRASYFGVIENHYDEFGQPSMYALSSNSTIDIEDFIRRPTVIVIQSATTNIADALISLLVSEIYRKVVKIAKGQPNKRAPRNIHCFLDEFANCNIADGPQFIKMLTTSRKFGMFWHLFLQCDAQLDRKFDSYISNIIRSNCTEIFMGSNDYATCERFAKSCGYKTVESLASKISPQVIGTETVPLLTAEYLNMTQPGHMYVKRRGFPLLKTYFEAFYTCEEFEACENIDDLYPYNTFDYTKTCRYPDQKDEQAKEAQRKRDREKIAFDLDAFFGEDSNQEETENEIIQMLEKHIKEQEKPMKLDVLPKCSCIPDYFKTMIKEVEKADRFISYEALKFNFPETLVALKFEIIETYIMAHDYKTKNGWERRINEEYKMISEAGLFPWDIQECFYKAMLEITMELTLSNIKEIKNIISNGDVNT